jgi:toxin FitB
VEGALAKRWGVTRRGGLDLWPAKRRVLPAGLAVAEVWGRISASTQQCGRPRPLNDAWIAACCIEAGLPLLTLNHRDFADFAEHDGLVLLTA